MLSTSRLIQIIPKNGLIKSITSTNGAVWWTPCVVQHALKYSTATYRPTIQSSIGVWPAVQNKHTLTQPGLTSPVTAAITTPCLTIVRHANFFNKHSADQLWKGVVSVSKYGKMKGRGVGRNKKLIKNLNRGQFIGVGASNMVWAGLNTPVFHGQEVVKHKQLDPDPDYYQKLLEIRDRMEKRRKRIMHPLERGWSGVKMAGRKLGPPDPVGTDTFDGFETICLEYKMVSTMKTQGRIRKTSVFSVTGNGQGLAGFALGKALMPRTAIRVSKNRAGQTLLDIPIYDNHTVIHDFYSQFGITKLFVKKMHKGYGLVCHRAIKAICETIGIKDLHAKVEGAVNVQNVTKAFFLGLIRQKSYQQLAEEKGLHVVELKGEKFNYPTVMASPVTRPVRSEADISLSENLDFNIHVMDGRVRLVTEKTVPDYTFRDGYQTYLKKYMKKRNNQVTMRELILNYGKIKSFHHDNHPECIKDYFAHRKTRRYDAHKVVRDWPES